MSIPTLSYAQNDALSDFLMQSGLTEEKLYEALDRARKEEEKAEHLQKQKENAEKYGGKCFKVYVGDGVDMYYRVIAPYGVYEESVSCIFFGMNPMLERICGDIWYGAEVMLTENTQMFSGTVETGELDKGEEISEEEFAVAFRDWTERVLKLRWDV